MALQIRLLKPGIVIVNLATHVEHAFERRELNREERITASGAKITKLETELQVDYPDEFDAAKKLQGKVGSLIRSCCSRSNFGLICPPESLGELETAKTEVDRLLAEWQALPDRHIRVSAYVALSQPATDTQAWTAGIADEVQSLMALMEKGIATADVETIREAANRARQLGAVLDEAQAATVDAAVDAARKAAREIVKRVQKEGESAADVVRTLRGQKKSVEMARFAFLDILREDQADTTPAVPQTQARQLDIDVEA